MSFFSFSLISQGFPASDYLGLQGKRSPLVTWSDLVWAAVTVGKREAAHVLRYGFASEMELTWRAYLLFANLQQDSVGLIRSDAFKVLDPSEKTAVSYFLGLTMAKLCAEKELQVSWLMHLDVYKEWLRAKVQPSSTSPQSNRQSERPDLVGRRWNDDWITVEAKGRSGGYDAGAMQKAKIQAGKLTSVQNAAPTLSVALVACFQGRNQPLAVHWKDPEPEKEGWQLEVEDDEFFKRYYAPFVALLLESPRFAEHGERRYRVATLREMDVTIGIDEEVLKALANVEQTRENQLWKELGLDLHRHATSSNWRESISSDQLRRDPNLSIGGDGVMVELGPVWSSQNMRLAPPERS